eukprot:TRINITY_DN6351_c0_g1_i1.p1 TRINITY_DN6351_c0_g1~~TRINITY_DN6351_c0_g1_i1.p1  ORF type:complete len:270 (-),score=53.92 TRINITY_DN6351_c0_g1_i1:298-1107(-)
MQQIKKYHIKPLYRKPSQNLCYLRTHPETTDLPYISAPSTSRNTKPAAIPTNLVSVNVVRKVMKKHSDVDLSSINNSRQSLHPQKPLEMLMAGVGSKRSVIKQRGKLSKLDNTPSNKLKDDELRLPNCTGNYATGEPKAYVIRKRKCYVQKTSPSTFQLPTEDSYNKVNELFNSIRSLVQKPSKGHSKERLNTATTDATEKQTQELHWNCSAEELQELSMEEDLSLLEDLKPLRDGVEEGENIELVPCLGREDFGLEMAVCDVMFIADI